MSVIGVDKDRGEELLAISKETVIATPKEKIISTLVDNLVNDGDKREFLLFCRRVAAAVRAAYASRIDRLLNRYSLFEPADGTKRLEEAHLTAKQVEDAEVHVLTSLIALLDKASYKPLTRTEFDLATKEQYMLNVPVAIDAAKIDSSLFDRLFASGRVNAVLHPEDLPEEGKQYLIFRRGVGMDKMTDLFVMEKIDVLLARFWKGLLELLRISQPTRKAAIRSVSLALRRHRDTRIPASEINAALGYDASGKVITGRGVSPVARPANGVPLSQVEEITPLRLQEAMKEGGGGEEEQEPDDLRLESIRLETLPLTFKNFMQPTTIQEPTFQDIVVVHRPATPKNSKLALGDRTIFVKHFRHIPMADLEVVLPEKKNPGLTPMDWVLFLSTFGGGLAALAGVIQFDGFDWPVIGAILAAVFGFLQRIYFLYQRNVTKYENLVAQFMYNKQADSGKGTLLNVSNQVIEQEVKEVIIAYYILMTEGKATQSDLDERCEDLLLDIFHEKIDFDVSDACDKMKKLGIAKKDVDGYVPLPLKKAVDAIGQTTEETIPAFI